MIEPNLPPETDNPEVGELASPPAPKGKGKSAKADPAVHPRFAAEKRIKIVLEENDNIPPTGLFIGINGQSFMLRPGEEASVPASVVAVLDDAVEENPRTDANGNVLDYRKKLRFPYRMVG